MQNLYRHFDKNNELLYVGVSLNSIYRLSQHKNSSLWFENIAKVTIECFNSRGEAIEAEKEAIYKEHPIHNVQRRKPQSVIDAEIVEKNKAKYLENVPISKKDLLMRVTSFNPVYTMQDASNALCIPVSKIKELIKDKKIGCLTLGFKNTRFGMHPILRISGWQLIDFIDNIDKGMEIYKP